MIDGDLAVPDSALVPLVFDPSHARVGAFVVEPGRFAATWARGTLAVLTWACDGDGGRHLTLSTGERFGQEQVSVELRVGSGEFQASGEWTVNRDVTDALRAPAGAADRLTERALAAEALALLVIGEPGTRHVHEFGVGGLARALGALRCWP